MSAIAFSIIVLACVYGLVKTAELNGSAGPIWTGLIIIFTALTMWKGL